MPGSSPAPVAFTTDASSKGFSLLESDISHSEFWNVCNVKERCRFIVERALPGDADNDVCTIARAGQDASYGEDVGDFSLWCQSETAPSGQSNLEALITPRGG